MRLRLIKAHSSNALTLGQREGDDNRGERETGDRQETNRQNGRPAETIGIFLVVS